MSELLNYQSETLEGKNLAIITMDDGKANSLSPAMIAELAHAFDRAEKEQAIVIFTGRAGRFCAGFDLSVLEQGPEAINEMALAGARVAAHMLAFPFPVIIACNGHGLAMGGIYLLCADYRIGVEGHYKIGLNEVALGMTMPPFAKVICSNTLTPVYLKRSAMQAEVFNPEQACAAGFLDEFVTEVNLLERAREKALAFTRLDMRAFRKVKLSLRKEMLAALADMT